MNTKKETVCSIVALVTSLAVIAMTLINRNPNINIPTGIIAAVASLVVISLGIREIPEIKRALCGFCGYIVNNVKIASAKEGEEEIKLCKELGNNECDMMSFDGTYVMALCAWTLILLKDLLPLTMQWISLVFGITYLVAAISLKTGWPIIALGFAIRKYTEKRNNRRVQRLKS